ncbi:MAG: hypothetical protein GX100_00315, partial [candidate division WS1 bacterium]|nr:hypothetical protein [candidate division WS1 bacterium]
MEIRSLTTADLEAFEAFYRSLSAEILQLFAPFGPDSPHDQLVEHLRLAEAGEHVSFGLFSAGGDLEGHCYVSHLHGEQPSFGLGLRERTQGQGWGPKLMAAAMEDPRVKNLSL